MSEFTAQLFVPLPLTDAVDVLRAQGVKGAVLPHKRGSVIIAPWEDWAQLEQAFAELWAIQFAEDYGLLDVQGWRNGQYWLSFQLNATSIDDLEELLDEDGLYPDGSPGPELARVQSVTSVTQAAEAGHLSPELSAWMLRALERRFSARYVLHLLPSRLGFGVMRWLSPDFLTEWTQADWAQHYPQAIMVN